MAARLAPEARPSSHAAGDSAPPLPRGVRPSQLPAREVAAFVRSVTCAAATGLLVTLVAVRWVPGWVGASLGVGQGLLWCAALLWRHPRRWLANIVTFGLVTGFVELLADSWLVRGTGTLRYPAAGPFLFDSPAYMPAAWFGMLSAGMALGIVARRHVSFLAATLLVSLACGVYIPLYEALAQRAAWWSYTGTALLGGAVPPYVVLGEVLLALPLVAATERLVRASPGFAALLGVGQGLWIGVSYAIAWGLVGG